MTQWLLLINHVILALALFFSFFSSTFRQTRFSTLSTIDPVLLRQYPPPSHNPYAPPGQRGPGFGQDLFFVPLLEINDYWWLNECINDGYASVTNWYHLDPSSTQTQLEDTQTWRFGWENLGKSTCNLYIYIFIYIYIYNIRDFPFETHRFIEDFPAMFWQASHRELILQHLCGHLVRPRLEDSLRDLAKGPVWNWVDWNGFVWKCRVPLNPMVLLIIIPIKWLFHWEYTLFSDKPKSQY